jgi:hypothetical protein
MPKPPSEQPSPSRSDIERDLGEIDKLKGDFDQELTRSEQSGDFSKSFTLKKEIDDRVAALKARMETVRAFEPEPTSERVDLEFAEKLFGRDYLGPQAISEVWSVEIPPDKVPEIPFSQQELERAKELNQFLILRAKYAADGGILHMYKMHELLSVDMLQQGRGKVLADTDGDWNTSNFFIADSPVTDQSQNFQWALTSKTVHPGTIDKDYAFQTGMLADYLRVEISQGGIPKYYEDALRGYEDYRRNTFVSVTWDQINAQISGKDWHTYARDLTSLKINQLLRPSPAQAQFDVLTYYQSRNVRLPALREGFIWTNARSKSGHIVTFGDFDKEGAKIVPVAPGRAGASRGALVSRT